MLFEPIVCHVLQRFLPDSHCSKRKTLSTSITMTQEKFSSHTRTSLGPRSEVSEIHTFLLISTRRCSGPFLASASAGRQLDESGTFRSRAREPASYDPDPHMNISRMTYDDGDQARAMNIFLTGRLPTGSTGSTESCAGSSPGLQTEERASGSVTNQQQQSNIIIGPDYD